MLQRDNSAMFVGEHKEWFFVDFEVPSITEVMCVRSGKTTTWFVPGTFTGGIEGIHLFENYIQAKEALVRDWKYKLEQAQEMVLKVEQL